MEPESKKDSAFISYPTNRVAGTINEPADAQAAVEELIEAGFSMDQIDVLYGEEGMRRLDPSGEKHGLLARLQRTFLQLNEEPKHLRHHVEDVLAGRFVFMVLAEEPEKREKVGEILKSHGGHFINFYGRWAMQSLAENEQAPAALAWQEGALPIGHTYEVNFDGAVFHFRFESESAVIFTEQAKGTSETVQITGIPIIKKGVFMLSWQEASRATTVSVWDFENEIIYTNIIRPEGTFLQMKGTLKRLR
jgi:hypothetical protein